MLRFVVDADRVVIADDEVVELFWRGVNQGSSKWRWHRSHVGIRVHLKRRGDEYQVELGDLLAGDNVGDVAFEVPVTRRDELQAFVTGAGIRLVD